MGPSMAAALLILLLPLSACGITSGAEAEQPPAEGPQEQPQGWVTPEPAYDYPVREGRSLYFHYCSHCHGTSGEGDGFNAFNLDPRPRNLADPAFQKSRSEQDLSEVVRRGGRASGLSSNMPPWGRTLNDRQIGYIVRYLRTLKPQDDE